MICSPQAVSEKWPALVGSGATAVLAVVAIFQWLAMRENNKAMAGQAETMAEQTKLERDRWQREDLFQRLQWFDSHFNSPAMLIVRVAFGKSMLENENLQDTLSRPLGDAQTVICFFTQVAERWNKKQLELNDIDIVFGDYIVMLCTKFKTRLDDEDKSNKYKDLFELNAQLQRTETQRWIKGDADAAVSFVQKNFWKREAALLNKN